MFAQSASHGIGGDPLKWGYACTLTAGSVLPVSRKGSIYMVDGSGTINRLTPLPKGAVVDLHFNAAPTLVHSTLLLLPGSANVTVDAGSVARFISLGNGVWRCVDLFANFARAIAGTTDVATARSTIAAAPIDALAYNGMQINGGFEVSQENGSSAISFGSGTLWKHIMDCFTVSKSGTSVFSIQQVASVFPGYAKALKLTVSTAQASIGTDYVVLAHIIEGYRFARAGWGTTNAVPVTFGFWVKSSVAGVFSIYIVNAAGNSSTSTSVTIAAANTAQWVTATFTPQTTGSWDTSNGVGAYLGLNLASNSSINIVSSTSNTFEMTGFIVLPGTEVPASNLAPLIMRPYSQELLLCQRYYYKQTATAGLYFYSTGYCYSVNGSLSILRYPVRMRSTPTMTFAGSFVFYVDTNRTITSIAANSIATNNESACIQGDGSAWGEAVGKMGLLLDSGAGTSSIAYDARL